MIRGCEIDTKSLPSEEAKEFESFVKGINIKDLRETRNNRARDLKIYQIEVETGKEIKRITFDDMSIPTEITSLFELLKSKAKPQPLK